MKGSWMCLSWREPRLTLSPLPCPHLFFVQLFSLREGVKGGWGGGADERSKSKVDNHFQCTHTHTPEKPTSPGPSSSPQNIFISIIKQFFYMLIHQSVLGLIFRRGAGWCVPLPLFRCATLPSRHLSRCVAHKAPALSALIDQTPAIKEGSSIPYQWCSTSAPEKGLRLLPQHAQRCR